jgi:hypothetical protein
MVRIMDSISIDPNKLNYVNSDIKVFNRVKKLFQLLDEIILGKSKSELHIISKDYLKLLNEDIFETNLKRINQDKALFNKYQILYYTLIKYKHFNTNNTIGIKNNTVIFIVNSLNKYINNISERFFEVIKKIPRFDILDDDIINQLWEKFDDRIMHFIVTYCVFPYITEPIFDYRRICSYCNKVSDVTFIRCYGCRIIHYCSNLCQYKDYKSHKNICLNLYQ